MAATAQEAGVQIVTGDTKVVNRAACDKLFINTDRHRRRSGSGSTLGAHRAGRATWCWSTACSATTARRFSTPAATWLWTTPIESDCAPLHGLIEALLAAVPATRFIRDATRGGVATVLNEIAEASQVGIEIDETAIPMREEVKGFCEILGLDPLYLANEGKIVCCRSARGRSRRPRSRRCAVIRSVARRALHRPGRPTNVPVASSCRRSSAASRIVDMLVGEQLPRIC